MSGPRIAPFFEVCHDRSLGLESLGDDVREGEQQLFVVLKGGYCMGYWWKRGDVVSCDSGATGAANVVLIPRGYGWPRLGRQNGYGDLCGDAGEPCRFDRWAVAGLIVGLYRCDGAGVWSKIALDKALESPVWTDESWDRPARVSNGYAVAGWPKGKTTRRGKQLSLFTHPGIAA